MIRALRSLGTANLLLSMALFAAYLLYGSWAGLPLHETFFGMGRSHLGRGSGPMVPPWTFFAIFEALILTLLCCSRFFDAPQFERTFCVVFVVVFLYGILIRNLPHRVIFPEDEQVIVVALREQVLMWYLCCSNAFYALFGPNED
jgi:hypothetical protein